MRRFARRTAAASWATAFLALLATAARAQAPPAVRKPASAQERRRAELLRELGLKKGAPDAAPSRGTSPVDAPATVAGPSAGRPRSAGTDGDGDDAPVRVTTVGLSFRRVIHPLLIQGCTPCHAAGGTGAVTRFKLARDATSDYETVLSLVNLREPGASLLLAKPSGAIHGGGAPWPPTSIAYGHVLAWIQRGARLDGAGTASSATAPATAPDHPVVAAKSVAVPVTVPVVKADPLPLPLPAPAASAAPSATPSTAPDATAGVDFASAVHPLLMSACATCHGPTGPAATSRLVLSGDSARDLPIAERQLDLAAPTLSPLLTKSAGLLHAGGVVLPAGDARRDVLLAWINEVALRAPAALPTPAPQSLSTASPGATSTTIASSPPTTATATATATATQAPAQAPPPLPFGFMLNGRFDVAYERRQFSGSPFAAGGIDALRSYHHFLFLTRDSTDDPFGISLELLSLQFWEVHARLGGLTRGHAWQLVLSAGKLIVPFGAEPLMHQSYGGLSGFDQRILPVIWAQEGAAAHLTAQRGALALTDDLFVVRGYRLQDAGGVLNLQSDLSPADDTRLGWGNRIGVGWLNLSAWYSAYFNPLGFGRRVFMQAVDVMLWRPRGVPVLGHFSASAGALRADVSGGDATGVGGPGMDYYHFGSYLQLRYHPTDWLYLQYRQGLHTFNNRRGLIVDDTRLTAQDGSAHNFGVVAKCRGVSLSAFYFINLEKVDEIADDLLRVSVTYDF